MPSPKEGMISVQEVGWHLCILQQTWSLTWLCQGASSHALGLVEPIKLVSQLTVFSFLSIFCDLSPHVCLPFYPVGICSLIQSSVIVLSLVLFLPACCLSD